MLIDLSDDEASTRVFRDLPLIDSLVRYGHSVSPRPLFRVNYQAIMADTYLGQQRLRYTPGDHRLLGFQWAAKGKIEHDAGRPCFIYLTNRAGIDILIAEVVRS